MRRKQISQEAVKAISLFINDGHTGEELATKIGADPATVSRIRNGQQRRAKAESVDAMMDVLTPYLTEVEAQRKQIRARVDRGSRVLPVVSSVHCAEGAYSSFISESIDLSNWDGETVTIENDGRRRMAFRAEGDSMDADPSRIQDGDIVVVDMDIPLHQCANKPVVVIFEDDTGDEQVLCKRLSGMVGGKWRFTSDNKKFPKFDIPPERLKFVWLADFKITPGIE